MQGRVLAEVLERPAVPDRIDSWENTAGESGMHPPETSPDAWDSAALMEQMVALGYLEAPAPEMKDRLRQVRAHQAFSLARVYLGQGNAAAALPLMEEVTREFPEEITYQVYLAQCCYETGHMNDCRRIVRGVLDRGGDRPAARVLEANLLLAEGRIEEGLAGLLAAEQSEKPTQGVRYAIGRVYLSQKRWDDAERAFRSLIAWDEDSPRAHAGLAQALLEQGKFEAAAEAAADAIGLRFDLPDAHLTLGRALAGFGEDERAVRAFETCLALRPDSALARAWLARLRGGRKARRVREHVVSNR
jgi:predicted Zn-dependent protease